MDARVGNGAKVAVLAIDVYSLSLSSGLVLELNNCYYIPALGKNIISSSYLEEDGYNFKIKNKCCLIYLNGMLYGNCPLINGLYILDLEDVPVYNINTKKPQLNDLNSTFIWHCLRSYKCETHAEAP